LPFLVQHLRAPKNRWTSHSHETGQFLLLFSSDARETKLLFEAVLFDWDGTLLDSYEADSAPYLAIVARRFGRVTPPLLAELVSRLSRRQARCVLASVARRHRLGLVTSGERFRVTPKLEMFNTFNNTNNVTVGDPRQAQLSVKLEF
jgi:hypothetical protein